MFRRFLKWQGKYNFRFPIIHLILCSIKRFQLCVSLLGTHSRGDDRSGYAENQILIQILTKKISAAYIGEQNFHSAGAIHTHNGGTERIKVPTVWFIFVPTVWNFFVLHRIYFFIPTFIIQTIHPSYKVKFLYN